MARSDSEIDRYQACFFFNRQKKADKAQMFRIFEFEVKEEGFKIEMIGQKFIISSMDKDCSHFSEWWTRFYPLVD